MNDKNKIIENLKKGKLIISITNILTAIIFFIVYLAVDNIIILFLSIIMLLTALFLVVYFNKVQKKYESMMENDK